MYCFFLFFFFQAEDGIRDGHVTGVQTCALPISGGDSPSRGFLDAYDAARGKRLWRFETIPSAGTTGSETWSGDSARIGGGATWLNGAYDPELNLIYWGVGNPYPDYDDDARNGDNLFTDSVIALDADTGKRKWHFQYTPHDLWDWD